MARRPAGAIIAVLTLTALGLTACGATGSTPRVDAGSRPATSSAPTAVNRGQQSGTPEVASVTYDQEAVTTFGQRQAEQGYEQVTTSLRDYSLQPRLLATATPTAQDFDGLADQMSLTCAQDFRTKVTAMLGGSLDAYNAVGVLTLYGTEGKGFTVSDTGQVVSDWTIDNAEVSVDRSTDTSRLRVTEQQQATIHGHLNGDPAIVQAHQTATCLLVPSQSTATGWAIDGWQGTFSVSDPVAAR